MRNKNEKFFFKELFILTKNYCNLNSQNSNHFVLEILRLKQILTSSYLTAKKIVYYNIYIIENFFILAFY